MVEKILIVNTQRSTPGIEHDPPPPEFPVWNHLYDESQLSTALKDGTLKWHVFLCSLVHLLKFSTNLKLIGPKLITT